MTFTNELTAAFTANANAENAKYMQDYMKGLFTFYGIKTDKRRKLFKTVWDNHKQEIKANSRSVARELYTKVKREYHYCAIEILVKELKKNFVKEDIKLIEFLITHNSWWDSVDVIAKYLLGVYLHQFPEETKKVINRFSGSNNMWLNRSAILFQLGYKNDTDEALLFSECLNHKNSSEFFIQKAIGWALREYGKVNPLSVSTSGSHERYKLGIEGIWKSKSSLCEGICKNSRLKSIEYPRSIKKFIIRLKNFHKYSTLAFKIPNLIFLQCRKELFQKSAYF